MRILYGVQGTGNGHITRARVMAGALRRAHLEVDYLFSGRPAERYFNMEPFGDYRVYPGLTLATDAGRVRLWRTLGGNNLYRLWRDVRGLDLSGYDLVITDFEPDQCLAARAPAGAQCGHRPSVCLLPPGAWYREGALVTPGTEDGRPGGAGSRGPLGLLWSANTATADRAFPLSPLCGLGAHSGLSPLRTPG